MRKLLNYLLRCALCWTIAFVATGLCVVCAGEKQSDKLFGLPRAPVASTTTTVVKEFMKGQPEGRINAVLTLLDKFGTAASNAIHEQVTHTQRIIIDASVQPGMYGVDLLYLPSKHIKFVVKYAGEDQEAKLFDARGKQELNDEGISVHGNEIHIVRSILCIQSLTITPYGLAKRRKPVSVTVPSFAMRRCASNTFLFSEDHDQGVLHLWLDRAKSDTQGGE